MKRKSMSKPITGQILNRATMNEAGAERMNDLKYPLIYHSLIEWPYLWAGYSIYKLKFSSSGYL